MKVKEDSRTCFGILWFDDEAEAVAIGQSVRESGATINGGFYHGKPCDRDPGFDTEVDGKPAYAVVIP